MLLAAIERDMGIAEHFAGLISDPRNPAFITQQRGRYPARAYAGDCLRGWRRP
jgi:hypothetical protein